MQLDSYLQIMPRKSQPPAPETASVLPQDDVARPIPELVAGDEGPAPTQSTAQADAYASAPARYESFEAFYPFYLSQHSQPWTRRLHVIGTGIAILCLTQVAMWGLVGGFGSLIWALIFGYGFAWAAHYFVEKNQPATFTYPAWSLMGDFKMFWEVVTRKREW
jgi:hypothetical protein